MENEADKMTLIERYADLEFADDVSEYKCVHCGRVAITHFFTNCDHVICRSCKFQLTEISEPKCPKCKSALSTMNRVDEQFESKIMEIWTCCPNKKHGCKKVAFLSELVEHIKMCPHGKSQLESTNSHQNVQNAAMEDFMKNMMAEMQALKSNLNAQQEENVKLKKLMQENETSGSTSRSKSENSYNDSIPIIQRKNESYNVSQFEHKLVLNETNHVEDRPLEMKTARAEFKVENINNVDEDNSRIGCTRLEEIQRTINEQLMKDKNTTQPSTSLDKSSTIEGNTDKPITSQSEVRQETGRQFIKDPSEDDTQNIPISLTANKTYHVLLLGQTGVGKSTFINAFVNYLTYNDLDEGNDSKLLSLIPSQFSVCDDRFQRHIVKSDSNDKNENLESEGQSVTQGCKTYPFHMHNFILKIIDTPGIGDTRGIEQDKKNLNHILEYISQYDDLHAICILLKPNESRLTTSFEFCIKQLLCHLQKDASKNIIFVFTNSRNTFYRPGDTVEPLQIILNSVKNTPPCAEIAFNESNIYCLDNEAFRFLVALKNGINFSDDSRRDYGQSWLKSVKESQRMINYIVRGFDGNGIKPHRIKDTISVNAARQAISQLSKPLAEVAQNLQDNIKILDEHMKEIEGCKGDINKLKNNLYVPEMALEVIELPQPRTVCQSEKCRQMYNISSLAKYHYPVKCHDPCYLKDVPRDVVGDEKLRHCSAIHPLTALCKICKCHYSQHLHIYYESLVVEKKTEDNKIKSQLNSKHGAIAATEDMIKMLKAKADEYRNEEQELTKYTAKLAIFLNQNALVVTNDAFKEYLLQMIANEKSLSSKGSNNREVIQGLEQMLKNYEAEIKTLKNVFKTSMKDETITADDVFTMIDKLSAMKVGGRVIQVSLAAQNKHLAAENKKREDTVFSYIIKKSKNFFGY